MRMMVDSNMVASRLDDVIDEMLYLIIVDVGFGRNFEKLAIFI